MFTKDMILVAEDSESDTFVLRRAFEKANINAELRFVEDGQDAVDYLSGSGVFGDRKANSLPKLLLLDLRMPRLNGFDVLGWVKKDSTLRRLPVAVFSSSNVDKDVDLAYDLGANSYLIKPHSTTDLADLVERLKKYWLEANRCPYSLCD